MATSDKKPEPKYIFRPWITLPDGRKLYARNYGKKAFKIPVNENPKAEK